MGADDDVDPVEYLARVIYSDPKLLERFRPPAEGFIRAIRDASGVTRAEAAGRLGIKPQSLARIEKSEADGVIGLDTLRRVARVLDCTVVYALIPNQAGRDSEAGEPQAVAPAAETASRQNDSLLVDFIVQLYFDTARTQGRSEANKLFNDIERGE